MRAEIVGIKGPTVDMIWQAELKRFIMLWYPESSMGLIVFREKSIE
jgi:hypothetical protein